MFKSLDVADKKNVITILKEMYKKQKDMCDILKQTLGNLAKCDEQSTDGSNNQSKQLQKYHENKNEYNRNKIVNRIKKGEQKSLAMSTFEKWKPWSEEQYKIIESVIKKPKAKKETKCLIVDVKSDDENTDDETSDYENVQEGNVEDKSKIDDKSDNDYESNEIEKSESENKSEIYQDVKSKSQSTCNKENHDENQESKNEDENQDNDDMYYIKISQDVHDAIDKCANLFDYDDMIRINNLLTTIDLPCILKNENCDELTEVLCAFIDDMGNHDDKVNYYNLKSYWEVIVRHVNCLDYLNEIKETFVEHVVDRNEVKLKVLERNKQGLLQQAKYEKEKEKAKEKAKKK